LKSKFPAVCGGEGVGRVLDVGERVKSLKPGDIVFPTGKMDVKNKKNSNTLRIIKN